MRLLRGRTEADAAEFEGRFDRLQYTIVTRSRHRHGPRAKGPYCPLGVLRPIHLLFTWSKCTRGSYSATASPRVGMLSRPIADSN